MPITIVIVFDVYKSLMLTSDVNLYGISGIYNHDHWSDDSWKVSSVSLFVSVIYAMDGRFFYRVTPKSTQRTIKNHHLIILKTVSDARFFLQIW